MTNKLKILIADDHALIREGLKTLINSQDDMHVAGEACDGREAVALAQELRPDIVVMDISMPNLNGLTATAQLKRIAADIRILTLTRHTDSAFMHELLQAGVSGYVLKQSTSTDLIRAIRAIAAGGNYLDPAITGKMFATFTGGKKPTMRGETLGTPLTDRESEVLRYIALGYTNREIADEFELSTKTVEAHKANAMQKLNIKSRREIMSYAILQGWMQEQ